MLNIVINLSNGVQNIKQFLSAEKIMSWNSERDTDK